MIDRSIVEVDRSLAELEAERETASPSQRMRLALGIANLRAERRRLERIALGEEVPVRARAQGRRLR